MTAATLTYSWDGRLQTSCPSWCDTSNCDGTAHVSEQAEMGTLRQRSPLSVCVAQFADEAEPYISLEDAHGRRQDKFTADEAERLAHALLDHAKILRAHDQEVTR